VRCARSALIVRRHFTHKYGTLHTLLDEALDRVTTPHLNGSWVPGVWFVGWQRGGKHPKSMNPLAILVRIWQGKESRLRTMYPAPKLRYRLTRAHGRA
jgi:hypothetical protein